MSSYFIAQIKINDPIEYEKYLETCDEIFAKYNGEYLAVDDKPTILEGEWSYTRIVIIRFSNEEELMLWYNSKEYKKISEYRLNAAKCDTLIVKGLKG